MTTMPNAAVRAGKKPPKATPTPTLDDIDRSLADAQSKLVALQSRRENYSVQLDDAADDEKQFALISDAAAALDAQITAIQARVAALGRKRRMVQREQVRRELAAVKSEFRRELDAAELLKVELAAIDEQRADIARCHKAKIERLAGMRESLRFLESSLAELEPVDHRAAIG